MGQLLSNQSVNYQQLAITYPKTNFFETTSATKNHTVTTIEDYQMLDLDDKIKTVFKLTDINLDKIHTVLVTNSQCEILHEITNITISNNHIISINAGLL